MVPPTDPQKPAANPAAPETPASAPGATGKPKVRPMIKMLGVEVEAAEEVSQLIPLSQVAPELFAAPPRRSGFPIAVTASLAILFAAVGSFAGYAWKTLQAERSRAAQTTVALTAAQAQLAEAQTRTSNAETRVRVLEGERETLAQDAAVKAKRIVELESKLAKAQKSGKRRR